MSGCTGIGGGKASTLVGRIDGRGGDVRSISIARRVRRVVCRMVGSCIEMIAVPTWIAIVCSVTRSIGVVGHVTKVAFSVGIAVKLVISVLHCFVCGLCLDFNLPFSVGRSGRSGGCSGCDRHYSIACISVDDVAGGLVDLEVGGPGSVREIRICATIMLGGIANYAMVSSVGGVRGGGGGGSDFGARILAGRIPRVCTGRYNGGSCLLMFIVLVSSE